MTPPALVIGVDGHAISRDAVTGRARLLLEGLNFADEKPAILPFCSRFGDFLASVIAARHAGLRIVLPNDAGFAAINSVIAETGDVIVLSSAGDDTSGLKGMREIHLVADAPADTAPLDWGGAAGAGISLFTSGTTGAPVRHTHPFAMLDQGAEKWAGMIGAPGEMKTLVCTVPPQHMYGLEAGVMLPLSNPDFAVYDVRPFFAANVAEALNMVAGHRVLVSTPLHLDLLVREDVILPPIHAVVSATTALDSDLAQAVEKKFRTRVIEVFGTTETGLIGTREPARNDVFTPRDDFRISFENRRMNVMSAWRAAALTIDDMIEASGTGFHLVGRGDDLINVAGKRASLAGLTQALRRIDGVRDGVFVMPEADPAGRGPQRPVAFAVAPGMDTDQVRRALRHRIAPAFVPRRIVMLDEIPKTRVGKPHIAGLMGMLADRNRMFSIPDDHPSLAGHFPGNPIVPGAVVLDHALRAAGISSASALKSVKFTGVLRAREDCTVETSESAQTVEITCRAGTRPVMRATVRRKAS
ncbi:MAG: acyl-CoA synthetase [Rhodospirillales bacterium]|nr:acyl-CoA synthetase [Rhodospirillales bacterium]